MPSLSPADRLALDDLVHRYALLVDQRAFTAVGELFTPDAELVLPDPPASLLPTVEVLGRDAVVAALGRLTGFATTFHAVVGRIADTDPDRPDRATGRVACEAHHVSVVEDGQARDLTWYLHYDDAYAQVDGRWLIARRALTVEAITTGAVRKVRTND
jgi:hypothetical protein